MKEGGREVVAWGNSRSSSWDGPSSWGGPSLLSMQSLLREQEAPSSHLLSLPHLAA